MCGIISLVGFNKTNANFNKFNSYNLHRGPDSQNIVKLNKLSSILCFQRLSINDLSSNGNMPFISKDGNVILSANCEIYNFLDLKKNLIDNYDCVFQSNSDAEVILHGYLIWGKKIFKKIKGMFSIIIFDMKKEKIYVARDFLGIKPLFFYQLNDQFIFSSEFIPLIKICRDLNFDLLKNKKNDNAYIYDIDQETMIKNIFKFKPGHLLELRFKNKKNYSTNIQSFRDLSFSKVKHSYDEKIEKVDKLLNKAIKSHLISDAPLSILLSGGIDSALLCVLAKNYKSDIETFTININNSLDQSDLDSINLIKKKFSIKNTMINVSNKELIDSIEHYVDVFDDLSSYDGGFLTNLILCQKIRSKYKVLLLGDGADELFGGYSWFGLGKYPFKLLPNFIKNRIYTYASLGSFQFDQNINANLNEYNDLTFFDKIRKFEIKKQLPNHYLNKVDRSSMYNSIEARVPYLDNDLVDYVLSLNEKDLVKGNLYTTKSFRDPVEKRILRDVSRKYLPLEIVNKKKKGFSLSPLDLMKTNPKKIEKYLFDQKLNPIKKLDKIDIKIKYKKLLNDDLNIFEKKKYEILIWKLFINNIWHDKYGKYFA